MLNKPNMTWPQKPLSEVMEVNPRLDKSAYRDELEVSFVPMAAVEAGSGRIDVSQTKHFKAVKKGYTPFKEGDVLFAKITPCMENGKMAVVPKLTNDIGFGSTEFHVLRPHEGIDPRYVYYFVSNQGFRRDAAHQMTGAVGQKRVPQSFLEEASIPAPLFEEQKRIVAEIEKQFSRLDEAVASLKRTKASLKRYKAAVLKAAVEGKLKGDDRTTSEHADVGPSHWRKTRLEDICDSITDGDHQPPPKRTSGIPFLTIGNISRGRLDFLDTRYVSEDYFRGIKHERIPKSGDVLYTVVGATIGIPVLVNTERSFCFQRHIAILKPKPEMMPRFLWILMASPSMLRAAWKGTTGSAQPTLPLKTLRALPVNVPPLAEQEQIVAEVERRLSVIDELEATVEANLTRADRLRQAILGQAFSGKLVAGGKSGRALVTEGLPLAAESPAKYRTSR